MAPGPQKPSSGCPAGDFYLSPDEVGNVKVRPMVAGKTPEMMEWVRRKLLTPDLPLTEQVIGLQNIIGRAIETLQGTTGPTMEELKEFAGRMGFDLVPRGHHYYGASFLDHAANMVAKLPGTDWVIAWNEQLRASRQPRAHPAQPGLSAEVFWTGGIWTNDLELAKRFPTTERAINEMTWAKTTGPYFWDGAYLARVAAKPEPRYEVVDRP